MRERVGLTEASNFAKYRVTGTGRRRLAAGAVHQPAAEGRPHRPDRRCSTRRAASSGEFSVARVGDDDFFLFGSQAAEAHHSRWFLDHLPADGGVDVPRSSPCPWSGSSLAGPHARDVLQSLTRTSLATADFPFMAFRRVDVGMIPAWVGRMTYSGDLGYEIWMAPEEQRALFDLLWAAGEPYGMRLFGFRALMSLRMEKSFGTWFREYRPIYTPLEAGMDRYLKLDHDFIGREALEAEIARGARTAAGRPSSSSLDAEEPADVIGDEPIWHDGQVVGWVTSGAYAHHSGLSLALGYVPAELAEPGAADTGEATSRSRSSATAAGPPAARAGVRPAGPADAHVTTLELDGAPLAFSAGDTVALAVLRAGAAPRPRRDALPGRRLRELRRRGRRGGVRPHVPDAGTRRHGGAPAPGGRRAAAASPGRRPRPACAGRAPPAGALGAPRILDVAVVGQGESGRAELAALRAEGRDVLVLDAGAGQEVVTIDRGPTLIVRVTDDDGRVELVHAHAHEVVLATGAAELQPVCPGNRLRGLLTGSAAVAAHAAGVELPDAIAVGDVPDGLPARAVAGRLVRLDGDADGAVSSAVLEHDGILETHPCRTVVVGLGSAPRRRPGPHRDRGPGARRRPGRGGAHPAAATRRRRRLPVRRDHGR